MAVLILRNMRMMNFCFIILSFIHGKYPDGKDIKTRENDIIKAHEYALKNIVGIVYKYPK